MATTAQKIKEIEAEVLPISHAIARAFLYFPPSHPLCLANFPDGSYSEE